MYDTYHHYIYLWYLLVLCPVDFSERASAECAWGSSATASFPEKKCGESKSNASVYSDLRIYIYIYIICIHIHTMHTSTICLIEVSARRKQLYPAPLQTLRTDGRSGRPVPPCLRVWLMDYPPVVTSHHLLAWFPNLYDFMVFSKVFFGRYSGWVHAKVSAEFLVLCSIVFLLYKCSLSILINICTRNFILLLKKKVSKVFFHAFFVVL